MASVSKAPIRPEDVQGIFRHWLGVARYPDIDECYHVASVIETIRAAETNSRMQERQRQVSPSLRAGRALLRHLNEDLTSAKAEIPPGIPAQIVGTIIDQHYPHIRAIEAAQQAVGALLPYYTAQKPDPAQFACAAIMRTWHSTAAKSEIRGEPAVKVSKGTKPNNPLCRAVTALLTMAGFNYSLATVSDMLRDRARGRPRGGRKSGQKVPN
jgi:hypothetical protein